MHDIIEIIKNIHDLYESNSSMSALKDFERVLDEMGLYVYKNWLDGELAYGPQIDRHWITVGFMWPKNSMPDPMAAKRLTDVGCHVKYQKSHLVKPRTIKSPNDYRPGTKKGKLDRYPIWIVEIQMPKKLAFDVYRGYMNQLKHETEETKFQSKPQAAPGAMPAAMPPAGPMGMQPGGMAPPTPPTGGMTPGISPPGGVA